MSESPPPPPPATTATAQPALAQKLAQKLAAEFLGTFVLVFLGVGSVVILGAATGGPPGVALAELTAIGLTFGIAVMVMMYAVGRISGGHFNPAVSFGAAIGGRVSWAEALLYMLVQVVSAIVAAAALFLVAQGYPGWSGSGRMGADAFGSAGSGIAWWAALVLEAILTLVFVVVILAVTDSRNEHPALAPLAIGFTLAAIHFVAIPATGTSVNPARSIGPALFGGAEALQQLWLFIVAPLLGGALAGLGYPAVFGRDTDPVAGSGLRFGPRRPAGAVPGYGAPDQLQQQWQQAPGQWQPQQYPPQQPPDQGYAQPSATPGQPPPQQQGPRSGGDEPDDGRTQIRPQQ
jgi:aquaporin Z